VDKLFLKKDGITQNHKVTLIGMFLIVIIFAVLIVIKDGKRKALVEEYNKGLPEKKNEQSIDKVDRSINPKNEETNKSASLNNINGESLDEILEKNTDKKKLLFFFASWNKESIIMLEEIKNIAKDDNNTTKFVVVEVEGSNADSAFFENSSLARIQCEDAKIPAQYMVNAIPTIVVLEKNNNVLTTKKGSMSSVEIRKLIN
jgi:thioredoxin-like negative regulator of GroEL